jgi:hypothetical protein
MALWETEITNKVSQQVIRGEKVTQSKELIIVYTRGNF